MQVYDGGRLVKSILAKAPILTTEDTLKQSKLLESPQEKIDQLELGEKNIFKDASSKDVKLNDAQTALTLADENGDGVVDRQEMANAAYQLLSDEDATAKEQALGDVFATILLGGEQGNGLTEFFKDDGGVTADELSLLAEQDGNTTNISHQDVESAFGTRAVDGGNPYTLGQLKNIADGKGSSPPELKLPEPPVIPEPPQFKIPELPTPSPAIPLPELPEMPDLSSPIAPPTGELPIETPPLPAPSLPELPPPPDLSSPIGQFPIEPPTLSPAPSLPELPPPPDLSSPIAPPTGELPIQTPPIEQPPVETPPPSCPPDAGSQQSGIMMQVMQLMMQLLQMMMQLFGQSSGGGMNTIASTPTQQ